MEEGQEMISSGPERVGLCIRDTGDISLEAIQRIARDGESRGVIGFFLADSPEASLLGAEKILGSNSRCVVYLVVPSRYLSEHYFAWIRAVRVLLDAFPRRVGVAIEGFWTGDHQGPFGGERLEPILAELAVALNLNAGAEGNSVVMLWVTSEDELQWASQLGLPFVCDTTLMHPPRKDGKAILSLAQIAGVVLPVRQLIAGTAPFEPPAVHHVLSAQFTQRVDELVSRRDDLEKQGADDVGDHHASSLADLPNKGILAIYEVETDGVDWLSRLLRVMAHFPDPPLDSADCRIRRMTPDLLDEQQTDIYTRIRYGSRGQGKQVFRLVGDDGALEGPFNAWLLSPAIGSAMEHFGDAMRFACTIDPKWREIAILAVGTYWGSVYEQYAHEAVARQVGLTGDEIAMVRAGRTVKLRDPVQTLVAQFAWHLLEDQGRVDDEFYWRAVETLGEAAVFEITVLVGYYSMLALQLEVFKVSVPLEESDD